MPIQLADLPISSFLMNKYIIFCEHRSLQKDATGDFQAKNGFNSGKI